MKVFLLFLYGAVFASLCTPPMGAGQDERNLPSASSWLPFEIPSDSALPIVQVRLNRQQAQSMVVDFSVQEVLVDTILFAGTGMKPANQGEMVEIEYYGQKEKVPVAYLDTVEVGGVGRQGVRTLLIDSGDDIGVRDGLRAYGRIGFEFLEAFRLTVHYPRRLLLLELSPEEEVPAGGAWFERVERALAVDVVVNGSIPARFVIDPGSSVVGIDKKWAQEKGLVEKKAKGIVLSNLRVGDYEAGEVRALLGEMKKLPYGGSPVGVIGASFLLGLSVTYDFPRSRVWLRRVGEPS